MAGTITALRFQRRNSERVNIYLDGQFAFALPALVAADLKPGQHLSDPTIESLKARDELERAYERSLQFLAYRPRSVAEVRRYLSRRGLPEDLISQIVDRLLAAQYLDDEAFAQFWVSNRERFNPRGPQALRYELRQKGISDRTIARTLQSVDSEQGAYQAGVARARRYAHLEKADFRRKLGNYLLRRGFGHDLVWPVVEQLWQELHSDSDDRSHTT